MRTAAQPPAGAATTAAGAGDGSASGEGVLRGRWWRAGAWVGLFALAVVLPLLRQQGVAPWDVPWAEDAVLYYGDATTDGVSTVLRGYDGYLQLAPRVLMLPAAALPVAWMPAYAAVCAAILTAALAAYVFRSTAGWIATTPFRLLVAAFVVIGPATAWETTGNLTNLIWPLLSALPWVVVSNRRSRADLVVRGVIAAVAPLSNLLAAIFLPLALVVSRRRRRLDARVVAGAMTAGVLAQAVAMVFASERHAATASSVAGLYRTVSVNVLGSFLVGERYLPELWVRFGLAVGIVATVVTATVFLALLWDAAPRSRAIAAVFVVAAALVACAPLVANGTDRTDPVTGTPPVPVERYVVVPVLYLVAAAALLADPPDASRRRTVARVARPLLVVHSACVVLVSFAVTNPRSAAPRWEDELRLARARCGAGAAEAVLDVAPPGWFLTLPCDEITG